MRALSLLVFCTALVLGGCQEKTTPEVAIRRTLDAAVTALESGDSALAAEALSETYADARQRKKVDLKRIAFMVLRRGPVLVALRDVHIEIAGDQADVKLQALAAQRAPTLQSAADLLPSNARAFDLTLHMVKEGKVWRIQSLDGDNLNPALE